MRQFQMNQRVRVVKPIFKDDYPIIGKVGTVARLCIGDGGAWVNMDEEIPEKLRCFTGENDRRKNHMLFFPEECEEAPSDGSL